MAFFGVLIAGIAIFILIIGILLCFLGLLFLLIYLIKRKTKKKIGFLIASIILLIIGISTFLTFFLVISITKNISIDLYIDKNKYPVINAIAKHDNKKLKKFLKKGANPNDVFNDMPALFWTCEFDYGANSEATSVMNLNWIHNIDSTLIFALRDLFFPIFFFHQLSIHIF